MQRIRMSLPFYCEAGWEAEVVTVDERYSDLPVDELLLQSLPADIKIHKVKALDKKWTAKLGLGSLALRSIWFYRKKVNKLLKQKHFDLVFFSTTQFPICILGSYWKRQFGVPYVIDMQDPWHSDYYLDKSKNQRPKKYWFSYRLHRYLEPIAMKHVSGLISVSKAYIDNLKARYAEVKHIPAAVITFGYFEKDMTIAAANSYKFQQLLDPVFKNIVYIGRGGADMHKAIAPLFNFLKTHQTQYKNIRLYFIGTSYAPVDEAKQTISPLAELYNVANQVTEITGRISYYHTLATLQQADALFIPGSDDPAYTASKIYPYLMASKPLLAIFNKASSAIKMMREYGVKHIYSYDEITDADIDNFLSSVLDNTISTDQYNQKVLNKYSAKCLTEKQVELFNKIVH